MSKIRNPNDLQDALDADFSWRRAEVSHIKRFVKTAKDPENRFLTRAGIPLLYAHWEGFVKASVERYIEFVRMQGHKNRELVDAFCALDVWRAIQGDLSNGRIRTAVVAHMRQHEMSDARFPAKRAVATKSNLGSTVFSDILISVGIDDAKYVSKYPLIDEQVLEKRNIIAHGQITAIPAPDAFLSLCDHVIEILQTLKNDLLNAAVTRAYLRPQRT